jgi:hypothetical protein
MVSHLAPLVDDVLALTATRHGGPPPGSVLHALGQVRLLSFKAPF